MNSLLLPGRIEHWPLAHLRPCARNAKTHDSDQVTKIAATAPILRRKGTKQESLIEMMRVPRGATIEEITAAASWQSHTVRGAIAGAPTKKLGLRVTSEKVEDREGV